MPSILKYLAIINSLTLSYIRLEIISFSFIICNQLFIIVYSILKKAYLLNFILFITLVTMIMGDLFLISDLKISLNLGVIGVGYSTLISNIIIFLANMHILIRKDINWNYRLDFRWMHDWFIKALYSGGDSLLRNIVYLTMIIKMINDISKQGVYWQATTFIWSWLLLPSIALGNVIKSQINQQISYKNQLKPYMIINSFIVILWIIFIPFYNLFFQYIMNIHEIQMVNKIVLFLLPFYIIFSFGSILQSYFYGIGQLFLLFYNNVIVNIVYYGFIYILYKNNIYIPEFTTIGIVFGVGLVISTLITFLQYKRLSKIYSKNYI